jgi:hypothetical protein
MDLANRALNEGDLGMAQTLLRRYWPGPHETDLRNWSGAIWPSSAMATRTPRWSRIPLRS